MRSHHHHKKKKKKEKPRAYVLEPTDASAGHSAVLRVGAREAGNEAIARQFYRWLKGHDHYEGKSIELVLPDKMGGGTAIVTVAMDAPLYGNTVVHLSIPHAGKGHYDIFHYKLYAVDVKNRRYAFPIPKQGHFAEEAPFERLSDFPEGERFSLSPERRQSHILDDDIVIREEEERRYSVPLDVPSRAHELFDEAFEELKELSNDRRLSNKQRKANARGMKRFRDVHDILVDQDRRRELKLERDWITETLRMMKESEDAGWYGQAERFLHGRAQQGSIQAPGRRREADRRQKKEHEFTRRTRAREQASPSGAFEELDAHIGALLVDDGGEGGEGVSVVHMLRIGTLLENCVMIAAETGDADMIAKLGTLSQVCGHCDHVGACHHRCKHCKHTAYCNTDCARADWTRHRAECIVIKK